MAGSTHFMGINPAFFVSKFRAVARGLGVWALVCLASKVEAQRRMSPSPLDTIGEAVSQADGLKILQAFRRLGIAGDYRLSFGLEIRAAQERHRLTGVLLGTQTPFGPLSRVDIARTPAEVTETGALVPAEVKRMLLQNGLFANALESDSWEEGEVSIITNDRYFDGLLGSDISVFDLLMPFTFWQDFKYEGRVKKGRPLQVFSLYPPQDSAALRSRVSRVELYLDAEFNALNRVNIYDAAGEWVKVIWVRSFKIVDGQGLPSQIDVVNKVTGDRAIFRVQDAAVGVVVPEWVFEPEGLKRTVFGTELARVQAGVGQE